MTCASNDFSRVDNWSGFKDKWCPGELAISEADLSGPAFLLISLCIYYYQHRRVGLTRVKPRKPAQQPDLCTYNIQLIQFFCHGVSFKQYYSSQFVEFNCDQNVLTKVKLSSNTYPF